jgi:cytoskeletal protein CcmA (bactofilin family)
MIFKRPKLMSNGTPSPANAVPSLVAQDVTIEGNVTTTGELHIDGTVYGAVRARSCVVDLNGFVHGEITADEVFIRGKVIGPIRGTHVNLYAGAQVEGDILNETISIENGANIYGMISRAEAVPPNEQAPANGASTPNSFGKTPSLQFEQDNYFDDQRDDSFRPIKVVQPR